MTAREPAVLVMAEAPVPGAAPLDAALGPERAARLRGVLLARTAGWARGMTANAVHVAFPADPAGAAAAAVRAAAPDGVHLFAQAEGAPAERALDAAAEIARTAPGPLLVVGTRLPALGDYHATSALADLRSGCDTVLGVAIRGGLYLLGLTRLQPRLLSLFGGDHDGEQTRRLTRAAAAELGLTVGMLHYERTLETGPDVRAMLADPLLPADVREVLAGAT